MNEITITRHPMINNVRQRKYVRIPDDKRAELVRRIIGENRTVIEVAGEMGLDYENAKRIYRIFRKEGRVRQTPFGIKKYCGMLKHDIHTLRSKVDPAVFNQIVSDYASMWAHPPEHELMQLSLTKLPAVQHGITPNAKFVLLSARALPTNGNGSDLVCGPPQQVLSQQE